VGGQRWFERVLLEDGLEQMEDAHRISLRGGYGSSIEPDEERDRNAAARVEHRVGLTDETQIEGEPLVLRIDEAVEELDLPTRIVARVALGLNTKRVDAQHMPYAACEVVTPRIGEDLVHSSKSLPVRRLTHRPRQERRDWGLL